MTFIFCYFSDPRSRESRLKVEMGSKRHFNKKKSLKCRFGAHKLRCRSSLLLWNAVTNFLHHPSRDHYLTICFNLLQNIKYHPCAWSHQRCQQRFEFIFSLPSRLFSREVYVVDKKTSTTTMRSERATKKKVAIKCEGENVLFQERLRARK